MEPSDDRLPAALDRLVGRGVLNRLQADAVLIEIAAAPAQQPPRPALRRVFGEIAGYLGAAFVIGATLLFLAEEWNDLGRPGRVVILAAMAVILFSAGLAVRLRSADEVRRRLASTLMTAAAAATAFATYAGLEGPQDEGPLLVAALAGLLVVTGGYLLASSALGQLGIAVAAFTAYVFLLDLIDADLVEPYGLGMLALGLLWAALAALRLVREHRFALAIAVAFALAGAQLLVISEDAKYLGYLLTALVAVACFAAYVRFREWVVLAGGVIGATVVVPEFLYDVTDGSLGAAGVLLVAGVTLLGGSLLGLRIRRTAEPAASGS
ncbi:MAG: hypothetical protein ABW022_19290 [Actinoplanes sp.]